mmetsp:Transcript_6697/g.14595  ORF Transcript_6697/g.14595 Transcript_6697/m.14595 type:complete len:275 (+) Transcript_6697:1090-1914(+)
MLLVERVFLGGEVRHLRRDVGGRVGHVTKRVPLRRRLVRRHLLSVGLRCPPQQISLTSPSGHRNIGADGVHSVFVPLSQSLTSDVGSLHFAVDVRGHPATMPPAHPRGRRGLATELASALEAGHTGASANAVLAVSIVLWRALWRHLQSWRRCARWRWLRDLLGPCRGPGCSPGHGIVRQHPLRPHELYVREGLELSVMVHEGAVDEVGDEEDQGLPELDALVAGEAGQEAESDGVEGAVAEQGPPGELDGIAGDEAADANDEENVKDGGADDS